MTPVTIAGHRIGRVHVYPAADRNIALGWIDVVSLCEPERPLVMRHLRRVYRRERKAGVGHWAARERALGDVITTFDHLALVSPFVPRWS